MRIGCAVAFMIVLWLVLGESAVGELHPAIDISKTYPRYWAHGGKPVVLLGGSVEDNLFQIPNIEEHLDLLRSAGGNYVRNTMSARDAGNIWQFGITDGKYDLNTWNAEYWRRFSRFLELCAEREIVVQIEVWATFDYYRDCWDQNPFNPKNNITYSAAESGLPTKVDSHPLGLENNFFWSIPAEDNREVVLKYQQRFVDKMLSYSLQHGNVLYCMDNETAVTAKWGAYWSGYIKAKAAEAGVSVHTTEMWDPWDLSDRKHNATFDHPETYSFVDISQNNHQKGQAHWDNAQAQRRRIADQPRPLNCVKMYGADTGRFGSTRDAVERFWRNVLGGMAATRFHRPPAGLGLGEIAQATLRSARMLTDRMHLFSCEPHNDLLGEREPNEAYCSANPGTEYAVFFTNGGTVTLDTSAIEDTATMEWLNVLKSEWLPAETVQNTALLRLECPSQDYWVVLIQKR